MTTFSRREFQLGALATAATALSGGLAKAQTKPYPTTAVKVIIPYAPGGSTDALTRPVLDRLTEKLGQPFVIENRGGAGSMLGTAAMARSAADGYTLLVNTPSFVTSIVVSKPDYTLDSFDSVAMLATSTYLALVPDNSPIKDIKGLIDAARQKNGTLAYATAGIGSSTHFVTEYFCMRAGVKMKHVPYRGIGPAMIGMLSGECDVLFTTPASGAPQIHSKQVRVLAYTANDGVPEGFPNAPSVKAATGLDYEIAGWFVMLGPKGLPKDVQDKLNTSVNDILKTPDLKKIYDGLGAKPAPMSPNQITKMMAEERNLWAEVAKFADIREQ